MVNSKNLKNPRPITTIIEAEEYAKLRKNLGHRNFTDWLREQIKQYNEGLELEKKGMAPDVDKGAIRSIVSRNNIDTTLDKYLPNWILDHKNHKRLNEIQDKLSYEDQLIVVTATRAIHNIWKGRLPIRVKKF